MKIKTKLNLGVGLLFVMIILLTLVGAFYIFSIKSDTENILKANYNTLEYSRNMLLALDDVVADENEAVAAFESNLNGQKANVTEVGEQKATERLQSTFRTLKTDPHNETLKSRIRQDIFEIMKLNMVAIKKKSDIAKRTAETANLALGFVGLFCFLIAFQLLVNLPDNIANPIKELSASIKEIANKNYAQRVRVTNHNEFGDLAKSFNSMAEKLQEYNNSNLYKLLFEKKRLETLINNMHDPVFGLDSNGIILFANDEALKITGLKSGEVIGKDATNLARTNDLLKSLIINALESDTPHPMKIFADGKESYFEKELLNITIQPTGEDQAIYIGDVIILRNITPFKELDFAKTNFIATVSHELKTPISSIKMSLQLLQKEQTGNINAEQQQLIESINEDTQRLLKITGELLDISQVETGNIHLSIDATNPYDIVSYAVEAVKVQADQKLIAIHVQTQEHLPNVKADAEKTAWVLTNFLTNAIRYSSENSSIEVTLKQENDQLVFQVTDKGRGIDNRYKSKIFDKYFQIPGSHKSGTGLGLAISKEFIESQNGVIGMESQLGLGSTFYFRLSAFDDLKPLIS